MIKVTKLLYSSLAPRSSPAQYRRPQASASPFGAKSTNAMTPAPPPTFQGVAPAQGHGPAPGLVQRHHTMTAPGTTGPPRVLPRAQSMGGPFTRDVAYPAIVGGGAQPQPTRGGGGVSQHCPVSFSTSDMPLSGGKMSFGHKRGSMSSQSSSSASNLRCVLPLRMQCALEHCERARSDLPLHPLSRGCMLSNILLNNVSFSKL